MVKIWTILNCAKKIFFVKIICSTHQMECFSTILGSFWKIEFLKEYRQARADLTKMVKNWIILNCAKKIFFFQNYLFHSSKEVFLHNFRQFLENWIFEGISTGADLTKMVKIWTILNCAKKIFFVKIICSTHQRKCFSTILGNFWKIEFLKEYRQARADLTKMVKIWTILNCAKKIFFCQNYLFHSSKEVFLHNFRQFLENWIFEGILTGADLTKMVKIWTILNCAKKIFFVKIICSTHQRKCFSTIFGIFGKLNFWKNIDRRGPYKNGENLNYLKLC